ncbi:MFS transporter [Curvibacter sp. APW13]|uniref:MFS transporter n=1 Tax=Curvibacter sp. APW13 TaxID=3077236 RepID=UPI0028E09C67|nr:MFS transporter [Curvibacter sp. APW13]MDT8989451.1 MFS transporter [Curvibacter sp. APW13]
MTRFYLSCLLAFTAGHMVNYTVILYLQETVGSDLLSGIGFGLSFGSSLLFGWFAGVLCDRVAPHRVIQWAQTLFVVCLGLLWWIDAKASGDTRVVLVMLAALFSGLGWSFVGPARLAALGQLADPARLKPATILFNVQVMLGFGLAPIVLAVQRHYGGWPWVFATGMALFAASGLMLLGIRTREAAASQQSATRDLLDSFAFIGRTPLLKQLLLAAVIAYAMTGPLQIMLPKLARETLGLSEIERGMYLGLLALSLIGGGIAALVVGKHLHHGRAILAATLVACLLFASLSQWQVPALSATVLALVGLLGGMTISFVVAGIQAQVPDVLRGRVMAVYAIISQVIPALSGVVAGVLVRKAGLTDALLGAGIGLALVAVAGAAAMPQLRRMAQ